MKNLIAALLVLLLAGCTATFFETPPLASQGCDPEAVGSWLSVPEESDAEGEHSRLRIDTDCRLLVDEVRGTDVSTSAPVQLHLGQHAGEHYAWFDANWMLEVASADARVEPTDVVVVRYRLRGERLDIWPVNDEAVDRLHDQGRLVRRFEQPEEYEKLRWITGPANPAVLELDGLFGSEPKRFSREERQP
ncbi:hypothetical protein GCM10011521_09440 [Arenimonas soli]|uniref:Lipoprotein n=1 Tax=Arenimonas soli TaxID=2269504 RepID=A0ABQ1HED1_9GAMM|nr:hypothetical protein [Arenimonas soli]GGA73385.1 hypothetical protein GCM10011521_09440 [Arenimonas soli]